MADTDIAIKGTPFDLRATEKLAREKPLEFESWAIMRMPGFVPNTVRSGDGGVDGRATLATTPADHKSRLALAQVKGGRSRLRDFLHVTEAGRHARGLRHAEARQQPNVLDGPQAARLGRIHHGRAGRASALLPGRTGGEARSPSPSRPTDFIRRPTPRLGVETPSAPPRHAGRGV